MHKKLYHGFYGIFEFFSMEGRGERGWKVGKENTGCLVSPVCVAAIIKESLELCSGNFTAFYVTHIIFIALLLIH